MAKASASQGKNKWPVCVLAFAVTHRRPIDSGLENCIDPSGQKTESSHGMIASETRGNVLVLHVQEPRVGMVVARKFREGLSSYLKDKPGRIVLDLKETEYFDSSALGALVAFMKDVKAYGGRLTLCNLSRSLLTLLKLSKLDLLFEISESLEKSLQ